MLEDCFGEGAIKSISSVRGFYSGTNKNYLKQKCITDYTCPRNPIELCERMREEDGFFMAHQKRRAQTEGRIGIFRNLFLGSHFAIKALILGKRVLRGQCLPIMYG